MSVALVNFSPRGNSSNSAIFRKQVEGFLGENTDTVCINIRSSICRPDTELLDKCEEWVLFYPLYVDALPSHMLGWLSHIIECGKGKRIYAVANCGFYDGEQTRLSLEVLKNWCVRSGMYWCGGVGIGASGCFEFFEKTGLDTGPRIPVNRALEFLAKNILQGAVQCNNYVTVMIPKRFYKFSGQLLWRCKLISNGVRLKDISRRVE